MPHVKSHIDLVKVRCPVYSAVVATDRSIRKCPAAQGQVGKFRADCMFSIRLKLIKCQCFMNFYWCCSCLYYYIQNSQNHFKEGKF